MRLNKVLYEVIQVGRMSKVPVHPNPRAFLKELYTKTLTKLEELPKDSFYRNASLAITYNRLNIIEKNEQVEQILKLTDRLQIEQLILEAKDEIKLLDMVKESKIWEPLEVKAPEGQWE